MRINKIFFKFLLRHDNSTGDDIILTEWLMLSNICHQRCTGCFGKNMFFFKNVQYLHLSVASRTAFGRSKNDYKQYTRPLRCEL